MFNGIESRGGVKNGGLVYCLYFIILVVFGNCILLAFNVLITTAVNHTRSAYGILSVK